MNTRPIYPRIADASLPREAVVTYSRVPSPSEVRATRAHRGDLAEPGRMEPTFEAAEVPFVDRGDRLDTAFADRVSDLGAARPGLDAGTIYGSRGGRSLRYVMLGSAVAVLAGIGVVAASVGFATLSPIGTPAENEAASETRLALNDPQSDIAPATDVVREIPLPAGEEATAAAPATAPQTAAPPVPRPRPEGQTASLTPPHAAEPETSAADEPVIAHTPESTSAEPRSTGGGSASVSTGSQSSPERSSPGNSDQLILSIEETLAKVDSTPAAGSTEQFDAGTPPVLPPPASSGPVAIHPEAYPPLTEAAPYGQRPFGPTYDVLPPAPVTDNGYFVEEYPPGPVPPESVPYAYPPQTTYYVAPPEEEERPGVVRRTISRTADAVSRVFSRD